MEVQQRLGGRYKLLNQLGSGGMAVVWKAHDEVLNRPVAIKLLAGRYAADESYRARIRAEARAAANLSHPNIAQVYDFGESDDDGTRLSYVVMELINGPTLAERVKKGPIPPRSVFRICGEVAAALAAAHAYGLVHRDIKPANVMVTPARAKVVDFGIAAAAGPGRPDDELLGTPAFLAPERLLSDRIEPASDVYALGVLLYRLLTNSSPWSVDSTTQMLDAHVYIEPDPMPQVTGVPAEITGLVQQCLLKDPAARPTAAEASSILMEAADMPPELHSGRNDSPRNAGPLVAALTKVDKNSNSSRAAEGGEAAGAGRAPGDAGASLSGANPGGAGKGNVLRAAGPGSKTDNGAPVAGTAARPGGREAHPGNGVNRRRLLFAGGGLAAAVVAALLVWNFLPAEADGPRGAREAIGAGAAIRPSAATAADPARTAGGVAPNGVAGQGPTPSGDPVSSSAAGTPSSLVPGEGVTVAPSARSDSPAASSEPPATSAPAGVNTKTLTSKGGSVVAECAKGNVTLLSWDPQQPYEVQRADPGPGVTASVIFKAKSSRIRMTVTCVAGVPTPVTLPL
ncbi:protein kinase [Actinoplanes sp. NPDC051633]|uniref:serine/threonine-protein kinase n=1 Tax=Actinoplanes sp. NPDC051633 TaxID=3155670 RepID=UPI0034157163